MTGDLDQGVFTGSTLLGSVRGTYRVAGTKLEVNVTKTPFLVGEEKIKKVISEFFEE